MKKRLLCIVLCCQVFGIVIYYNVVTQNRTLDFRSNSYNVVNGKYNANGTLGKIRDHTTFTVKANTTFSVKDMSIVDSSKLDSSLKFSYSEAAIRQYANAIHMAARKYVDIGAGQCVQRLPQCIIIGNFKSGTRELIDFMSMHPRIKILYKPVYEVEFFNKFYSRGLEWYRRKMPCTNANQITVLISRVILYRVGFIK